MMEKRALAAVCVLGGALAVGCEDPPDEMEPERVPPQEIPEAPQWVPMPVDLTTDQERGRELYETLCADCHGSAGRGDGPRVEAGAVSPPPDFTEEEYARLAEDDFEHILLEDPLHPYMEAITEAVEPQALMEAARYIPALVHPPDIPGSALAGRELYSIRCVACHGHQGRGDGRAVQRDLLYVDPPDLTTDTLVAAGDFDALFERVKEGGGPVHGSSMPAWRLALDDGDIWDLVAFIATLQPDAVEPPPGDAEPR